MKNRFSKVLGLASAGLISISMIFPVNTYAATSVLGSYDEITERYEVLRHDLEKYDDETEACGLLLIIYKAAIKDIDTLSTTGKKELKELQEIKKAVNAKINSLELSSDNEEKKALYQEYATYIDQIMPLIEESTVDQELYNNIASMLFNTNHSLAQVIATELSRYQEEYSDITNDYAELKDSYKFIRGLGQTGTDVNENGLVFVDGQFFNFDRDDGTLMEGSANKVYEAYDESGILFSFYSVGSKLNIFDSVSDIENGWYDSTPFDYETEVTTLQNEIGMQLEDIITNYKEIVGMVPELDKLMDNIDLGTNKDSLEQIKSPLIAFMKDYNILKARYAEIKELIYSGNLTEKDLKSLKIDEILTSLKEQVTVCEHIKNNIAKTLTNEVLSADNELALQQLYDSLSDVSKELSKDISTFTLIQSLKGSNDTALEKTTELLKELEIIKKEMEEKNPTEDTEQLTLLKEQNKELSDKLKDLSKSNSNLAKKINDLTSMNSNLNSQINSLKSQASQSAGTMTPIRSTTGSTSVPSSIKTSTGSAVSTPVNSQANLSTSTSSKSSSITSTGKTLEENLNADKKKKKTVTATSSLDGLPVVDESSLTATQGAIISSATGIINTDLSADEYLMYGDTAVDGVIDSVSLDFKGLEDMEETTQGMYNEVLASGPDGQDVKIETMKKNKSIAVVIVIIASATVIALGVLLYFFMKKKQAVLAEMLDEDEEFGDDEDDDDEEAPFVDSNSIESAFSEEEQMIAQMAM